MRKAIFISVLFLFVANSCKKAEDKITEIKDRVINAYWSDVEGLTIKIEDTEGKIVDFGTSRLGTNKTTFNISTPFLRNIKRTSTDTWTADIIKGRYYLNTLESVEYVPTTIKISTSSSGIDQIKFSDSDPISSTMYIQPAGYTPPADPYEDLPKSCDTTSTQTTQGNSASLKGYWRGDFDYTNFPVKSSLTNAPNPTRPCYYRMSATIITLGGNLLPIELILQQKPTQSGTYYLIKKTFNTLLAEGQARLYFEYNYDVDVENFYKVEVDVSAGKITANINNVGLAYGGGGSVDMTANIVLTGN